MVLTEIHQTGSTIKLPEMKEYLHKRTRQLWRMCVKEFIKTVAKELSPNVDTGMSLASIIPLGEALGSSYGMRGLIEAMIGGHGIKRGAYNVKGYHQDLDGVGDKSIAHGIQRGQKAYILDFGTASNPKLYFAFTIRVLQYYLHEHGLARPSSHMWKSLDKGKQAFMDCWNQNYANAIQKKDIVAMLKSGHAPTFYEE